MNTFLTNKSILVTGGTGFVGSHLVHILNEMGANVISTHQFLNPYSYFHTQNLTAKTTLIHADINNFDLMFHIITKYSVDYIFHLAAQPLVDVAYNNPRQTLATNIMGTVNILESARLSNTVKGIIVASSDKSYGKLKDNKKYFETDNLIGDHPYEVSKSATDLICQSYFKTYGIPVTISRFGNIYGSGDLNFSRIIPGILESHYLKKPLQIRSNGKFVRDYLHVDDVVNGYILLAKNIENIQGEAFNFGSNDTLSVIELINVVDRALAKKTKYTILDNSKNEIPYQSLDFSKAEKILKWKPGHTVNSSMPAISTRYTNYFKQKYEQ